MTSVLQRDTSLDTRMSGVVIAVTRVGLALLWIQNVGWKNPGDNFGKETGGGLYGFTNDGVTHPVFSPYASVLKHVVLPNFTFFGWMTLLVESSLATFLLVGLATRLFALVGVLQSTAIMLSVLNTPGEWHWSYYLMIIGHLFLFATAAGRFGGVDGVLRPQWSASRTRLSRLLLLAS